VALDHEARRSISQAVQGLAAVAGTRGYVTPADVFECCPDAELDSELFRAVAGKLEELDIEIDGPEDEADNGVLDLTDPRLVSLEGIDSDDTVSLYFREVGSVPLLTREEEIALAKRIERGRLARRRIEGGDHPPEEIRRLEQACLDGQLAYDHLVKANSRLVISMSKKYRSQGVPFLDLIQEGNVGLMRAADKFDYRRGFKFSTYATWWIRQAITRALANQGRVIRVPVHVSDRIRKLFAVSQHMEQALGRRPSVAELAAELELSVAEVSEMLRLARGALSLEKKVGEDEEAELGQFIEDEDSPDPLEEAALQLLQRDVDDILQCLTAREARILRMRYGLDDGQPLTLKEVGRKFHLTRERIRQIEQQAMHKLRRRHRRRRLVSYLE
jgi:RNA polymerase primary sigma factor